MTSRLPGPLCQFTQALGIDAGTLCRQRSPSPGPTGVSNNDPFAADVPDSVLLVYACFPCLTKAKFVKATFKKARPRGTRIKEIVIHDTGSGPRATFEKTTEYLADPQDGRKVSIHYLIGREEGEIVAMVPEDQIANQAVGHNTRSIGIELHRKTNETRDYTDWQYEAVAELVYDLLRRHSLARNAIIGHGEIEPKKRGEPHGFDWPRFYDLLEEINAHVTMFDSKFAAF